MQIINLTPHTINIHDTDQKHVLTVESNGLARCDVAKTQIGNAGNIPLFETKFGDVTGLPDEQADDTIFIVSLLVRQAVPNRKDVFSPGELLRNEDGQPIGCVGLSR